MHIIVIQPFNKYYTGMDLSRKSGDFAGDKETPVNDKYIYTLPNLYDNMRILIIVIT